MAENNLEKFIAKQKIASREFLEFGVKTGAFSSDHLNSDIVFLKTPQFDVISESERTRWNRFTLTIEGLIYLCSHNNNYKNCDTIRIYYPTEDVSKAFIKFLQYYIKEFRDKKIKIYTDDNYDEFVRRTSLGKNDTHELKDILYITEDDVEVVKNDLCINLKELEMPKALKDLRFNEVGYKQRVYLSDYKRRDFTTIDFMKEFKGIINGEYTPNIDENYEDSVF